MLADAVDDGPELGDGVVLSGDSGVYGPVDVGDNVRLSFFVNAHDDVANDCIVNTAASRPAVRKAGEPAGDARVERSSGNGDCPPPGGALDHGRAAILADWQRLLAYCPAPNVLDRWQLRLSPSWLCVRLYRATRGAYSGGHLRRAQWLWQLNMWLTGADLRPSSSLGPGLLVPYPACVSINGHAGRNLTVMALSGIDPAPAHALRPVPASFVPVLDDDVLLDHHTGVVGAVRVGKGVHLTPGARTTMDVAADVTLVPASLRSQRRARSSGPLSVEALHDAA